MSATTEPAGTVDILGIGADATKAPDAAPKQERASDGRFAKNAAEETATKREVFDKLMDKAEGEEPKPSQESHSPEPEPAVAQEKPAEAPAPTKPEPSQTYKAALKALEWEGWTADDLGALPEERVLALGKKARDRRIDISKKLEANAKQEKQQGDTEPEVQTQRGPAEPTRQAPDFKALVKPLAKTLALSDEEGDALATLFQKGREDLEQEVQTLRSQMQAIVGERMQGEVDATRKELVERFPKLAEDDEFEAALEEANAIAVGLKAIGRATSAKDVFEYVARARYVEPAAKPDNAKSDALQKKRDAGQPVNGSRATPPRALSPDQKKRRYFDALMDGEQADAALHRIYSG